MIFLMLFVKVFFPTYNNAQSTMSRDVTIHSTHNALHGGDLISHDFIIIITIILTVLNWRQIMN